MTLGVDPASVGPPISKTWLLKGPVNGLPPAYLGKVARSWSRDVAGLVACNAALPSSPAPGLYGCSVRWRTPRGLARTLGVAYLAGIAAVGVTLQLLLVLGTSFNRWVVIVVCVVLAVVGLAARSPVDPPARLDGPKSRGTSCRVGSPSWRSSR